MNRSEQEGDGLEILSTHPDSLEQENRLNKRSLSAEEVETKSLVYLNEISPRSAKPCDPKTVEIINYYLQARKDHGFELIEVMMRSICDLSFSTKFIVG